LFQSFEGPVTTVVEQGRSDGDTYRPASGHQEELAAVRAVLVSADQRTEAHRPVRLLSADGTEVEFPDELIPALLHIVEAMQAGLAVTVAPHNLTLSTQEAADLLRVSRTTLVRLLETGVIAFDKPNKHRRVRLDDLMEYRRRQRQAADQALSDMVADSQRLGLYDQDPEQLRQALDQARARRRRG
jgi:excisionase family DNA binding protein